MSLSGIPCIYYSLAVPHEKVDRLCHGLKSKLEAGPTVRESGLCHFMKKEAECVIVKITPTKQTYFQIFVCVGKIQLFKV